MLWLFSISSPSKDRFLSLWYSGDRDSAPLSFFCDYCQGVSCEVMHRLLVRQKGEGSIYGGYNDLVVHPQGCSWPGLAHA